MAHRGRLNVLTHVIGRPYETILREFEGERTIDAVSADPEGGTGDVKYHLGAPGTRTTRAGKGRGTLSPNPPHPDAAHPGVDGPPRPPGRGGVQDWGELGTGVNKRSGGVARE